MSRRGFLAGVHENVPDTTARVPVPGSADGQPNLLDLVPPSVPA